VLPAFDATGSGFLSGSCCCSVLEVVVPLAALAVEATVEEGCVEDERGVAGVAVVVPVVGAAVENECALLMRRLRRW
jgi:hypothetical protein